MEEKPILRELRTAVIAAIAAMLVAIVAALGMIFWIGRPEITAVVGYSMLACLQMFSYVMLADQINQVKKNG